jgi:hypothetical protein
MQVFQDGIQVWQKGVSDESIRDGHGARDWRNFSVRAGSTTTYFKIAPLAEF